MNVFSPKKRYQTIGAGIVKETSGVARKLLNETKIIGKAVAEKINDTFADTFYSNKINDIAQKTNFVQRSSSKIKGPELVQALVLASIDPESTPLSGINDNLREISPEARMTISGLRQRINCPEAPKFLKQVYEDILETRLKPLSDELQTLQKSTKGALEYFAKVLIHDSSSCTLNERLEKHFKGSGGAASKSFVKLDVIFNLKTNSTEEIIITDIREPDQGLSKKILKHVANTVLVIQDLGYFNTESIESIYQLGGYLLSRLPASTKVYLNEEDKDPLDFGKHFDKMMKKGKALDIEVYVSQKKIRSRVVAYKVPEKVFNKRVRDYRKKNKQNPTSDWIARQRFTILITNVPKKIWPWEIVGTVYKIRWQIELIFKVWKSQMSIDYLKGTKPERIKCLLYSRMIAIALIFAVYSAIAKLMSLSDYEFSLPKFVNWLKRNGRFATLILKGFTTKLWDHLINGFDLILKDRQKNRKTTQQLVEDRIPFLKTFKKPKVKNA